MNYVIINKKVAGNTEEISLDGYYMKSKNKVFSIKGEKISNIVITNKKMIHGVVFKAVDKKYQKLIKDLTDLLVNDDETGNSNMIILNMIEKFKQQIKNKYRKYLKKKELETMANKLKFIQNEAKRKQLAINNSYYMENKNNRSR